MAFDYAKAYQQFIDEEMTDLSATAWMVPEAGNGRFTDDRDVEIPTLSTSGLGSYDATKSDGSVYPSGTYPSISFGNSVSVNGVVCENIMMLDDLPCIFVPQSRMKTTVSV